MVSSEFSDRENCNNNSSTTREPMDCLPHSAYPDAVDVVYFKTCNGKFNICEAQCEAQCGVPPESAQSSTNELNCTRLGIKYVIFDPHTGDLLSLFFFQLQAPISTVKCPKLQCLGCSGRDTVVIFMYPIVCGSDHIHTYETGI